MNTTIAFLAFGLSAVLFCLKQVNTRYAFAAMAAGFAFALGALPNL